MPGSTIPYDPTAVAATISPTDAVDIRRYCGYPAYGAGTAGFQSWRYTEVNGLLEYRLGNLSAQEYTVVEARLTELRTLEAAIPAAGAGLNVSKAAVFTRNPRELQERQALFTMWRQNLCDFFGVPPGPGLASGMTMRMVV